MLVVSICRVHHFRADLAAVAGGVRKMFDLNVVLQGGQAGACLLEAAHLALVAALPKLFDPLPDQRSGILCNTDLVRSQWQCCSYGALICGRSDCFSIGNVCRRTDMRMWTVCRGGRRGCGPPSRSWTRTAWSRCDTATRLPLRDHQPPLGSCTGCSPLKWHQQ